MSPIIHSQSPSRDDEILRKAIQLKAGLEVWENEGGAVEVTDFIGALHFAAGLVCERFSSIHGFRNSIRRNGTRSCQMQSK